MKPEPKEVKILSWPKIQYFGFIKNRDQNKTLCMLKIDGRNMKLGVGQSYQDFEIEAAFLDSVSIRNQDEVRVFKKG